MTISQLQEQKSSEPTTTHPTWPINVTVSAGSVYLAAGTVDASGSTPTIALTDDLGNTYTGLDSQNDATNAQFGKSFWFTPITAGARTFTETFDSARFAPGIWIFEIGGADTSAPLIDHNSSLTSPAAGTDTLSITVNVTRAPALLVAIAFRVAGNPAPGAGTGFTAGGTGWNFTAADQARSETLRVTTTGVKTITFSPGSTGNHMVFAFAVAEAGATSGSVPGGFDAPTVPSRAVRMLARSQDVPLPGLQAATAAPSGFEPPQKRPPARSTPRVSTPDPLPAVLAPPALIPFGFDAPAARPVQRSIVRPPTDMPLPPLAAATIGPWGFDPPPVRPPPASRIIRPNADGLVLPAPQNVFPLSIHASGRYFVDAGGAPFFHFGISAWSIFTEPSDYRPLVDAAAALGIKMLLVRFIDETPHNAPNLRDGTAPFNTPGDFTTLNSVYAIRFRDFLRYCAARGIFVWVAFAYDGFGNDPGDGWRGIKVTNGTTGCAALGASIGSYLTQEQNVGIIAGGDNTPPGTDHLDQNLIASLQTAAPQITLVMAHPDQSTRSPQWAVSDDYPNVISTVRGCYSWFGDTLVGGTPQNRTIYTVGRSQYNASPTRPVVYLEAEYRENTLGSQLGTDFTTRFQAIAFWLETINGFGPGVGAEGFWPALLTGEPRGSIPAQAQGKDWSVSIALSCFTHLSNVKAFATSRQWWKLVPDQGSTLVTAGRGTYGTDSYRNAALASDGSFGLVYLPTGTSGGTVTVDMSRFYGPTLARWWSPTTNSYTAINGGVAFQAIGTQVFTAPDTSDWILTLEASPLPPWVDQPPAARPHARPALRPPVIEPLPGLAAAALTPFGFEAPTARPRPPASFARAGTPDIFPSNPAPAAGFDPPSAARPLLTAPPRATATDVFPPLVAVLPPWGWEFAPAARRASSPIRSADSMPLPGLTVVALGPWGWESPVPVLPRASLRASVDASVFPPLSAPVVLTAWGYDVPTPRLARAPLVRSVMPDPIPPLIAAAALAPWGFDSGPFVIRPPTIVRPSVVDPLPGLPGLVAWSPETALVRPVRSLVVRPSVSDPIPSLVTLAPWGFEVQLRALPARIFSPPRPIDSLPAPIVPPVVPIGPWGWELPPAFIPRPAIPRFVSLETPFGPLLITPLNLPGVAKLRVIQLGHATLVVRPLR